MASLGFVSPEAATEGVTPIFSEKTFCSLLSLLLISLGCHPLEGVIPLKLSDLVCPLFFLNLPTIFFVRVLPPGWCHPRRSAPPSLTPPITVHDTLKYNSVYLYEINEMEKTLWVSEAVIVTANRTVDFENWSNWW